jgi:predicted amino acid-binding ACT domain protein
MLGVRGVDRRGEVGAVTVTLAELTLRITHAERYVAQTALRMWRRSPTHDRLGDACRNLSVLLDEYDATVEARRCGPPESCGYCEGSGLSLDLSWGRTCPDCYGSGRRRDV